MRACWLKWVGRDWSISADYIWLNYSDANTGFGGSFTDAFVGQLFEPSMLFAGLIICLIASIFRYGYILQKQDDELL